MADANAQDGARSDTAGTAEAQVVRGRERGAVGWTTAVMAVAVAGLLVFNARSVRDWTETESPGPLVLVARGVAEGWWRAVGRLGLNAPRSAISHLWGAARAARWTPSAEAASRRPCGPPPPMGPAPSAVTRSSGGPSPPPACAAAARQR